MPPVVGTLLIPAVAKAVAQSSHGLAVADVVRFDGTNYVKAKADTAANAEVVGIVSAVVDANNFTLTLSGLITGLSGLTVPNIYFLSAATAGLLTATEPSATGQISKPLLIAVSTTSGILVNFRGADIGGLAGGLTQPQVMARGLGS